ncbi:hypothetical protein Mapa_016719 [Marchantia paleacea]|nr:hypothetical protein Mapa_016719 [Marchantia paleacea]
MLEFSTGIIWPNKLLNYLRPWLLMHSTVNRRGWEQPMATNSCCYWYHDIRAFRCCLR